MMTSVVRWVEVHRLAVAGREAGIARDAGGRVGQVWLARSRFADVARLTGLTLVLAYADRGLRRSAGLLIMAGYFAFVATLLAIS